MNHVEAAQLLGVCAAFDQRTVGESDVIAWQAALYDVTLPNARAAVVEHYRRSRDRVMPADVRAGVRRVRERALRDTPDPVPDADPDDVAGYLAGLRETRRRIADAAGSELPALSEGAGL